MTTVSVEEAQGRLQDLIAQLRPDEELILAVGGKPVARLTRIDAADGPCQPGSAKHLPHWMAPDFDAPLEDFREYAE